MMNKISAYKPNENHQAIGCYIALTLIVLFSLLLNLTNNHFPIYFHTDEVFKVKQIISGDYNFYHPLLMLQIIDLLTPIHQNQSTDILFIGRTVSAICGALLVWVCWYLYKSVLTQRQALVATLLTAVTPNLVIHAHYIKEDIYFTLFTTLTLLTLTRSLTTRSLSKDLQFACALGLACSAKYIGVILIPVTLIVAIICNNRISTSFYKRFLFTILPIALLLFLAINYPLLLNNHSFLNGLNYEVSHAVQGHKLYLPGYLFYFSFHIFYSLLPGMTLPVLVGAFAGIVEYLIRRVQPSIGEMVILIFGLIYYLTIEISPTKPWPDFIRYTMPLAPVIIFLAVRGISLLLTNNCKTQTICIIIIFFDKQL